MKKIIILSLLAIMSNVYGQGSVSMPTQEGFLEKIFIEGLNESFKYSDINGSAYIDDSFKQAKVSQDYTPIEARYNTYKDEIEFKQNNQIYVLPKDKSFSRIEFLGSKETLVLLGLNGKEGYFFELYSKNNKALLKRVTTTLTIPEKNKSTYADDSPPTFKTAVSYYIGVGDKFMEVPGKRKKIYDLFPSQKTELEAKVKAKNIDVNTDKGLIEFVGLL
ncbi:hypothetical protein ABXT08_02540 [Chryseobacterium sp. NRRL B-14859]|uniref:hypothetical protein n=1 Tax=Chryseobacterium sp. NRRL B-14859 TaxID=1562763 RepID=UPI00339A0826